MKKSVLKIGLILSVLMLAVFFMTKEDHARSAISKIVDPAKRALGLSQISLTTEDKRDIERIQTLSSEEYIHTAQEAFNELKMQDFDSASLKTIAILSQGLSSEDVVIKKTVGAMVRSILFDLAHGTQKVNEELKPHLNALLIQMRESTPELIEEIKSANSKSPALEYLNTI